MEILKQSLQLYFGTASPSDLSNIASFFKEESYTKGDFFLKQGQVCDRLGFIKSGMFRIYVDLDTKEVTQWISTDNTFLTDLASFVNETPARWAIQALADTEVYSISKQDYKQLGQTIPQWHAMENYFISKCFAQVEDRVFSHLSMSAEERYHSFYQNNRELFNRVPLQYIASMLGMTPETFSRIRKKEIS